MVFAWEAWAIFVFSGALEMATPSSSIEDAAFPACIEDAGLTDEGQAKKVGRMFNTPQRASGGGAADFIA